MATDYKQYNYDGYSYCGGSFASQGCGPTSVADILDISPLTVADWMTRNGKATTDGHGTYWDGINAALSAFGAGGKMLCSSMDGQYSSPAFDEFKKAIQDGYMGVLLMHNVVDNRWTNSGHYIACVGYKDGQYLIYDPASVSRTGYHPWDHFTGNICCLYTSTKRWKDAPAPDDSYTFTLKQVQSGDKNKYVRLGQRLLKSRGLYKGKVDSSFGPKTKDSVLKYQQWINQHGGSLKEDAILGPSTWQSLLGFNGIVDGDKVTFTVRQVQSGDKNIYVFVAQQILAGLGLYAAKLDMEYGPATTQAVRDVQLKYGIAVDSVCGPTTWKMLIGV